MNLDWRGAGFANHLGAIFFLGDLENLFPGGFCFKFAMLLDSREVVSDQRTQAGAVHLGHGRGPARAEVRASQHSAEGQLGLFQHLEDLFLVEGHVILVGCFRHHGVAHGCVELDQSWHILVEFEHHFVVEEWHVKNESDRAGLSER